MFRSVIWLSIALCAAVFVGPVALLASQSGRADPADLYFVVGVGVPGLSDAALTDAGARNIGPAHGAMARMIHAPKTAHARLVQGGFVMVPAGALAAICGIDADPNVPRPRSS
ncbi:hypothetical protein [uncultured Tateyamaria sp.]|uniref:hypothetical protein n=1 Tax=uncultured Tateyamaria sp. TaxID=455651 RepID=UPI002605A372|nr:hypothetical protein [uncultured Tateyamaria sp.]